MARVMVMTDSVAGIPRNLAEEYHITVVPAANIIFDGHNYIDGVTLSATEAYQLIKKDPDKFTTSALNPGYFLEEYKKLSQKSADILHITLSSALSANYKTAGLAVEMLQKESPKTNLRLFDAKTVAGAQGLIVLAAARAAAQGKNLEEVVAIAEKAKEKTKGLMMLDTLRYVYRTGRMSKFASRVAALLNIKPINRMTEEGTLEFVGKVRNREAGYQKLIDLIKAEAESNSLHFMLMHAAAPEMAERLSQLLRQNFDCQRILISEYSPVMGYGAGPGAIFIGFHPELEF
ncbi:MAG: DegV family EDD domain-containing protein [Dehalococcoidia bacterium]|nr:DegV family EDD domain-containing protein [Dehalococcoidia bacterium]